MIDTKNSEKQKVLIDEEGYALIKRDTPNNSYVVAVGDIPDLGDMPEKRGQEFFQTFDEAFKTFCEKKDKFEEYKLKNIVDYEDNYYPLRYYPYVAAKTDKGYIKDITITKNQNLRGAGLNEVTIDYTQKIEEAIIGRRFEIKEFLQKNQINQNKIKLCKVKDEIKELKKDHKHQKKPHPKLVPKVSKTKSNEFHR